MSGSISAILGSLKRTSDPTNFGGTYSSTASYQNSALLTFNSNGSISPEHTGQSILTDTVTGDTWYSPNMTGVGNSYWIRATLSSGDTPTTGSLNTWTSLASNVSWTLNSTDSTTKTSVLLIQISSNSSGTQIVCSGTITLSCYGTSAFVP